MIWRIRGTSQQGLPVKKGWHKGIWPVLAFLGNPAFWSGVGKAGQAAGGISSLMGAFKFGSGDSRDNEILTYNLPEFKEDPYYKKVQEQLYPFGTDLLSGDIPEYYAPIGEIGGSLFEDVLGMGKQDIATLITEDFARRNIRGARASDVIGKAVGDYSKKMRFSDLLRGLEGRKFLLGAGVDTLTGIRSGALTSQGQRNQYEIAKGNLAIGQAANVYNAQAAESQAIGQGIGSGISSLANIYAMSQLGSVNPDSSSYVPESQYSFSDVSLRQPDYGVPAGYRYLLVRR